MHGSQLLFLSHKSSHGYFDRVSTLALGATWLSPAATPIASLCVKLVYSRTHRKHPRSDKPNIHSVYRSWHAACIPICGRVFRRKAMVMFKGNLNNIEGIERISRRVQSGVEIFERETLRRIKVDACSEAETSVNPRLVVSDSRARKIVSKSRSQLGDIDAFLKSITRKPINIK